MNYNELEELVMESKGILRQSRDKNLGLYHAQADPKYWIMRGENGKEAREHAIQARDKIREIKNNIRQHMDTDQKPNAQQRADGRYYKLQQMLEEQDIEWKQQEVVMRDFESYLKKVEDRLDMRKDMDKKAAIAVGLTASFAAIAAGAAKIISKSKQNKAIPYLKKLDKLKAESAKITADYKSGKLDASDYVKKQLRIKNEIESCINSINSICKNAAKAVKDSVDSGAMGIYESVGYGYITEDEAEFLLSM